MAKGSLTTTISLVTIRFEPAEADSSPFVTMALFAAATSAACLPDACWDELLLLLLLPPSLVMLEAASVITEEILEMVSAVFLASLTIVLSSFGMYSRVQSLMPLKSLLWNSDTGMLSILSASPVWWLETWRQEIIASISFPPNEVVIAAYQTHPVAVVMELDSGTLYSGVPVDLTKQLDVMWELVDPLSQ
ncbi:cerebral cavernous malformations 2 -like, putative [Babesia ovis]|uniref:Cerebral cavernous malformations 2 -like, putative n=1 Tax=Babesia ovis TaxID=5869 RepID=A0A9W5TD01_BABOV|nr:cerebral cavernous malformations 2 -like, putative [Babesia ovis]